jgi:phosphate transport system substrate-binding protein
MAFALAGAVLIPLFFIPLLWAKKKKRALKVWLCLFLVFSITFGVSAGYKAYERYITIDTSPNINIYEYMPFDEDSKIVKLDNASLKLTENLPVIDGAAALFPVYSAFVHAVYPKDTEYSENNDGVFLYNNTLIGYRLLAEKYTDIFIGAYPSLEQREYAAECGTTFKYTEIGKEAFVFFVNKDNPIDNLSSEDVRGIYSGKITNWSQLGGSDEPIVAFQRNEGSGSQSMLERFMGDVPIMEPPKEQINDLMSGIITDVADYRNRAGSIGFSFRFYLEGIIKNENIKMLAIDGVKPTKENIQNGTYKIVTPIYAVSYLEKDNPNIDRFIEWMLSDEGQYIIEKTGYVGIGN